MDQVVEKMIEMEQQLRIWHWQTKLFSRHQAYGQTYAALGDLIDSFMEVYMGKYDRVSAPSSIQLQDLGENVEEKLDEYTNFLVSISNELNDTDTDLLNIRDEILALLNKLKYLLTLK
jgi:hypothetical protein